LNKIIENERGMAKSSCNFFGSLLQIHVTRKYENRSEDVKSKGTYHLREEQSPYSNDFTHGNNVLSPENT
jgi:hypothetical protein